VNFRKAFSQSKPIAQPFVVGLCIYTLVGFGFHLYFGKQEAHLLLNSWHFPLTNQFFKYVTHLGNGLLLAIIFPLLLFIRYSWALAFGISSLAMGVVVQLLKKIVFSGDNRPSFFFTDGELPVIDGVHLMLHHSFPSGHSATAFTLFLMLAFFVSNRLATYLFTVIAILAAFSRVYISQHFVVDTVVGAWIGLVITYLTYLFSIRYVDKNPASKLNGRLWV